MALSQRLEFRQTQALVMTPQLMQAIKLLQLSSLDLAAYVEGELERNPLLERADDGTPAVAGRDHESAGDAADGDGGGDSGGQADWNRRGPGDQPQRHGRQGLGTELENVFPDDSGGQAATPEAPPPAYSEWSGAAAGGHRRRLQSGSLRVGRDHARRSSRRADGAGRARSGATA